VPFIIEESEPFTNIFTHMYKFQTLSLNINLDFHYRGFFLRDFGFISWEIFRVVDVRFLFRRQGWILMVLGTFVEGGLEDFFRVQFFHFVCLATT